MPAIVGQFVRYVVTGGTAAIVDIGGFQLLASSRVPVALAAACSFAVATVVNFLLTARWVFRASADGQRYLLFLLGALLGGAVNVSITTIAVNYIQLPRLPAKVLAVGLAVVLNFLVNVTVVFRAKVGEHKSVK
jgi:putative flippase GtrA